MVGLRFYLFDLKHETLLDCCLPHTASISVYKSNCNGEKCKLLLFFFITDLFSIQSIETLGITTVKVFHFDIHQPVLTVECIHSY